MVWVLSIPIKTVFLIHNASIITATATFGSSLFPESSCVVQEVRFYATLFEDSVQVNPAGAFARAQPHRAFPGPANPNFY